MIKRVFLVVFFIMLWSCKEQDFNTIPLHSNNNQIQAVIEIPAGTNHKIEFNKKTCTFEVDKREGKDRVIAFLPYVGNYGFIPSTYSDPNKGGDGDAIDVLVLSESISTGTVIEIIPIGMLKLIDDGELDYKIIAVPYDKEKQIISDTTFAEIKKNNPMVLDIIEKWFLNYDSGDPASIDGWGNEHEAIKEINKNKSLTKE